MKFIPKGINDKEIPSFFFDFAGLRLVPKSGMLTSLYEQKCEQATIFYYIINEGVHTYGTTFAGTGPPQDANRDRGFI
ncbi:hypothetical protein J2TS6_31600 [Paenibacillus albilobatus]|uniref:Uncharacterized protein n=1 Tax=Paenibacillus albilobatus TaxID=2716884 RepID=A0A920CCK5_9BACL|nr:hypothetical protein J2TS6_31600 [Paenibacillus albilobatus]